MGPLWEGLTSTNRSTLTQHIPYYTFAKPKYFYTMNKLWMALIINTVSISMSINTMMKYNSLTIDEE